LFALPLFWLIGGISGEMIGIPAGNLLASAVFLVVGGLVALDAPLPLCATAVLAAILGATRGYADGSTLPLDRTGLRMVIGIAPAVFTVFALTVALVLPLRSRFLRIAMRVSGSWIAAAGLLLLGWSLRSGLRLPA
jgi:urease accessory protein